MGVIVTKFLVIAKKINPKVIKNNLIIIIPLKKRSETSKYL